MEVLYPVCCTLDVHQASVTACLRSPGDDPRRRQEVQTFGTTPRELLGLADWLTAAGCTHVAMESTGIYWRPVYNILGRGVSWSDSLRAGSLQAWARLLCDVREAQARGHGHRRSPVVASTSSGRDGAGRSHVDLATLRWRERHPGW